MRTRRVYLIEMGAYERLVADDEIVSPDGKAVNAVVDAQDRAKKRRLLREKLERLIWILASIAFVIFGDGSTDLVTVVLLRYKRAR